MQIQIDGSGTLFSTLINDNRLKNDAALARELGVAPPVISKIRHGRMSVGDTLILKVHEKFGMPVPDIRAHAKKVPA